ncbi:MAG: hypothetical protein J6T51_06475, partial [Kiritimatiellae bacterium]|nr:hypothetical protein [Kiritimatiellia bacterium]
ATGTVDGVEYRQISHQTAGDTAAGNPDCLYATLQIRGASSNTVRQTFKSVTEAIPEDLNSIDWWKQKHPRLANVAADAIRITDGTRSPSNYSRISAATAGELEEAGLRCEVSKFTCKATITTEDDKEEDLYLTAHFLTTNATGTAEDPKTYTWVTDSSSESGETVPTGLAAAILAERSGRLVSEKFTMRLGDALPTLGDAIVESDGTVFLQSFEVDCARLTAELSFGVPEHLTPEDMASLLSGFRNKCTTTSATMRKTGKAEDGGAKVELGGIPPLLSTEFAPGTKSKTTISGSSSLRGPSKSIVLDTTGPSPKLVITDGTKTISLDLADIPSDCAGSVAIRKLKYKNQNGDTKTCHGLFCDGDETPENPETPDEDEPGSDPDNPYEDPEDFPDDEDAIDADGNDISNDAGSLDDANGDYCNTILGGGAPSEPPPGNSISNTCSK